MNKTYSSSNATHKGDLDRESRLKKNNFQEHLAWLTDGRNHKSALASGFLYSLPDQRPSAADELPLPTRPAFGTATLDLQLTHTFHKAWTGLSTTSKSCKEYLRPGVCAPIDKSKTSSLSKVTGRSQSAHREPELQTKTKNEWTLPKINISEHTLCTGIPLKATVTASSSGLQPGPRVYGPPDQRQANSLFAIQSYPYPPSTRSNFQTNFLVPNPTNRVVASPNGGQTWSSTSSRVEITADDQANFTGEPRSTEPLRQTASDYSDLPETTLKPSYLFPDEDDDDLLQSIDIDQIVSEHYEKGCSQHQLATRQATGGRKLPGTPLGPNSSVSKCPNGNGVLVQEQHCCHGVEVYRCSEGTLHLQELKDRLIHVSNELLDNAAELSPIQSEQLRVQRVTLNKEIHRLEENLQLTLQEGKCDSTNLGSSNLKFGSSGVHTPLPQNGHMWHRNFTEITPSSRTSTTNSIFSSFNGIAEPDAMPMGQNLFSSTYNINVGEFENPPKFPYATDQISNGPGCGIQATRFPFKEVNYSEGSTDRQWSRRDFAWTKELEVNNQKYFGNRSFRPNQREIINASMSGRDVFVLMPTGGGKSLTYQLPAVCTPGVTLVVSPLVSLIMDQIMHLSEANIPAAYLSGNLDWQQQQKVLRELNNGLCEVKLLYVTPEKIAKSDSLCRNLENLYKRDLLARIVIDEAHCVSQWGHDFRPDYQNLRVLKQRYPSVALMALTATATMSVKEDVVQALGLQNCVIFRQTFNRPNLRYSVVPKTKKVVEDIDKFILENHQNESGIIYCLSRNDCEKVCDKLRESGHKVAFYHASMEPAERNYVQRQWSKDEVHLICATVAFGMGINKPDVRFVIHHSCPKSIEGYHQESGRAGRDNLPASCILYYSYGDYIRVKHMLTQGAAEQSTPGYSVNQQSNLNSHTAHLTTNLENLTRMVGYCENEVDCRRTLQLAHFGELNFNASNCNGTCDNCARKVKVIEEDMGVVAKQLVELVSSMGQRFSLNYVLDVYRGSLSQQVKKNRHERLELHGAGKKFSKSEVERILHRMVLENILREDVSKSDLYNSVSSILKVDDSKARALIEGHLQLIMRFPAAKKIDKPEQPESSSRKRPLPVGKVSSAPDEVSPSADSQVDPALSSRIYGALQSYRMTIVNESGGNLMPYHVMGNAALQTISKTLPKTTVELLEINGLGKSRTTKYGTRILELVAQIVQEYQDESMGKSSVKEKQESSPAPKRPRESV